jgi:hypothetical protein
MTSAEAAMTSAVINVDSKKLLPIRRLLQTSNEAIETNSKKIVQRKRKTPKEEAHEGYPCACN